MHNVTSFDTGHTYRHIDQCEPTAAQLACAWYQDSGGECSVTPGGCTNCPGKAWIAEQRARCGQSVFGGCSGPDCDRSCSATVNAEITKAHRAAGTWELLGWALVIWAILAGAMSFGLSREAQKIEISRRV
jgi:hypothetical protein